MLLFRWAQCRSAQPLLWDYASERLSEEVMERVELHLGKCASCHKELTSLKRAQGLLAACRAQEEPAPRSDWNDLQQRLVADGLAQIAPSATNRRVQNSGRGERNGMAGRAPWTMQLATSAAGGFAAVLVLALGYNALHLRNAPVTVAAAVTNNAPVNMVASNLPSAPVVITQTTQPSIDDAQNAKLVAGVINLMNSAVSARANTADSDTTSAQVHRGNGSSELRGGTLIPASMRSNERHAPTQPSSFASRRAIDKTLVSINNARKIRRDNRKTNARSSESAPTQIASRYALERVQPIGTDSDESNAYVVGSVRPISRDDEGVY